MWSRHLLTSHSKISWMNTLNTLQATRFEHFNSLNIFEHIVFHRMSINTNHEPCVIWDILPKRILNSNLAKSRLSITSFVFVQSFWNFVQSTAGTAVHCAKFQNDWTTETDVWDERDFARFEFKLRFGRLSYITQGSSLTTPPGYTYGGAH